MSGKIWIFLVVAGISFCHGAPAAKDDEPKISTRSAEIIQVLRNNIVEIARIIGDLKRTALAGKMQLVQATFVTLARTMSRTVEGLMNILETAQRPLNNLTQHHGLTVSTTTPASSTNSTATVSMEAAITELDAIRKQLEALMLTFEDTPVDRPETSAPSALTPPEEFTPDDRPVDEH